MAGNDIPADTRLMTHRERGKDRLSALPGDIILGIISRLPLQLAVVTETLSSQWRGLWTNLASINIESSTFSKYLDANDEIKIMSRMTSPVIHSFSFERLQGPQQPPWLPSLDSWLQHICDRNIRALKLTSRYHIGHFNGNKFPSIIFQTQSLVSIELGSTFCWKLPDGCEPINLPNLKNLGIYLCPSIFKWVEKQIKLCPSLEQLSLTWEFYSRKMLEQQHIIVCSNQKLRRLSIDFCSTDHKVMIDTPMIEYLAIRAPKLSNFSFVEVPVVLRDAKIKTNTSSHLPLSGEEKKVYLKVYEDISYVSFLRFSIDALNYVSTVVFRNVNRLTLDMQLYRDISRVMSLLESFPVLDILTLKYYCIGSDQLYVTYSTRRKVIKLRRALKRFEIQSCLHSDHDTFAKSFLFFVQFYLSRRIDFDHFKFHVGVALLPENVSVIVKEKESVELELCKLLYYCPTIPKGREVEFVGRCFTMSRKAGPKVKTIDDKVIPFKS